MKKIGFIVFVALCCCTTVFSQTVTPFTEKERIVFLGNSITDSGHYHSFIWLYYMTRFPDMPLRMMNAGVGGDNAGDMYKRLDADVLFKNPTTLVVSFGMNDSGYKYTEDNTKEYGEMKYEECHANYLMLEKRLLELPNTKIVVIGSTPYDEKVAIEGNIPLKGKHEVMKRIIQFQQEATRKNGWKFLDFNSPMTALNSHLQEQDSAFTLCGRDRIHPDNDGHMVMAYLFLKEQGFANNKVADMEVDASKGTIKKTINCEITDIKRNGTDFSFDYLAKALPYPLDTIRRGWNSKKTQADAMKYVPFMEEMNEETLKVIGLNGNYTLLIDEEEIGQWTGDELAKGINLAKQTKTPQYQQALAVMYLNEYRWEIERDFRDYAWIQFRFFRGKGLLFADNAKSVEVLDKEIAKNAGLKNQREKYAKMMHKTVREAREQKMETLISKIYEINKPQRRKITLRKM